jgi:signal transduction histidine kinase
MDKWERGEYKNQYLLIFHNKEEQKFQLSAKKADLSLFKTIAILSTAISFIYIFIDYFRVRENYIYVVTFRGFAVVMFFATFLFLSNKNVSPKNLQKIIIGNLALLILSFYALDMKSPMPEFFLSNALVTIAFFGITISGLRFRIGLLYELFLFSSFIVYANYISKNEFLSSQILNLFTNIILGIMTGYTLERLRRTSYFKNEKILSQNIVIRSKNEKLKALIHSKNKLISILSHDLKSPINSLKSLLDLSKTGDVTQQEFDIFVSQISERMELTQNLIDNILLWAKSQVSGAYLNPYPFSLKELTMNNIALYKEFATKKNIELSISNGTDIIVNAHQESINMVIRNLISNSIKFTPEQGAIKIEIKENGNYAEFHIKDSGVGISEENIPKLFEYENYTTLGTNQEKGSGLGLAICKDFILKNKGKIWVESQPNIGTTFKFKIPLLRE